MDTSTLVPCKHVVFTDFEGGAGVLVDLNTKRYYRLNETASLIWRALEKRATPAQIVDQMAAEYDVTPEHARSALVKLIQRLAANKLIKDA
jgi:hypothetical protein